MFKYQMNHNMEEEVKINFSLVTRAIFLIGSDGKIPIRRQNVYTIFTLPERWPYTYANGAI
jgi:hypothetical protein